MSPVGAGGGGVLSFLGQAVVIIVGWWVVHNLSARRDRDKARRDLVVEAADRLSDSADELLNQAVTYHTASERDLAAERRIKMGLQDLVLQLNEIEGVCGGLHLVSACRSSVGAARRAITGKHFEDEHMSGLSESEDQLQLIASTVLDLKRHLARLKYGQFSG